MKRKKSKFNRKSRRVLMRKCDDCGKDHEILEGYAYYFEEFKAMQPGAVLTCPDCQTGRIKL